MSFCFGGICGSSSAVSTPTSTPTSTVPNPLSYYRSSALNIRSAEARKTANQAQRNAETRRVLNRERNAEARWEANQARIAEARRALIQTHRNAELRRAANQARRNEERIRYEEERRANAIRRAANQARRDELSIAEGEKRKQNIISTSSHPSILKGKKILELLLSEDNKKLDVDRKKNKAALEVLENEILSLIPGATLNVYNYIKINEGGKKAPRVSYLKQAQSESIPAFRTILMYAAAYNFTRVVKELIERKPELLNRRNDEETPALVWACLNKSTESALILIANGEHLNDVSSTDSGFCYKNPIISRVLRSSDRRDAAIKELARLEASGRSMGGRTRKNVRARRNKTRNQRRRI